MRKIGGVDVDAIGGAHVGSECAIERLVEGLLEQVHRDAVVVLRRRRRALRFDGGRAAARLAARNLAEDSDVARKIARDVGRCPLGAAAREEREREQHRVLDGAAMPKHFERLPFDVRTSGGSAVALLWREVRSAEAEF